MKFLLSVAESKTISRLAKVVVDYFIKIPASIKEANFWFFNISNLAYTLIALLHTIWVFQFLYFGLRPMAELQLFSVGCYVSAILLNRQSHHLLGMIIAVAEVNIHQYVAVQYLGWNCGFQNFLPLISILPFLKYNRHLMVRVIFGVACMGTYVFLDFYRKSASPLLPLTNSEIEFFSVANAVLCFFLAGLWGIVLAISYKKTVTLLIQREQEVFALEKAAVEAENLSKLAVKEKDNEIFRLKNVELKKSNDEIIVQKQRIEELVSEQEQIIAERTRELAEANMLLSRKNQKLHELIRYNAHNIREPLTRILGLTAIVEDLTYEELKTEVWPFLGKAAADLDASIKNVVLVASETKSE